jgi:peptidoglycan-associated lipoprotein
MSRHGWWVVVAAIAALAASPIVAGCAFKQTWTPAVAGAGSPRNSLVAEADLVAPQTPATARVAAAPGANPPAPPIASVPPPEARIGLPRVRDYEAVPELRDIYFESGKATIRPTDVRILEANATWLRAHPNQLVLIEGHSDVRGQARSKNEWNMALGEDRARAAMNYLVAHGVQPSRITILSYGEERPLCTEQSERCWSQNRRSSFLVKPR